MILGAHESVAGGHHRAFEHAARDGADAIQLWTRSSRQWAARPLNEEGVRLFKRAHAAYRKPKIPLAAHASYLINLATANDPIYERSTAAMLDECERAEALGVAAVVIHPGAATGCDLSTGIRRAAKAFQQISRALGKKRVRILIELTAGQGSSVGCSFEQIADLLERTAERRMGVCLDTQHLWAAGIDWTTRDGYQKTMDDFDRIIGLKHLRAFHLNDSKKPLGSRVDRHEILGDGLIGLAPFARLVNDPRFADLPGFLETPPLPNGNDSFSLGLKRLRSLLRPRI